MAVSSHVALIIGSANGIGKATAIKCLKNNIKVCLADINTELGKNVCKELQKLYGLEKVTFVHCDITSATELEDAFNVAANELGKVNILVNCAEVWKSETTKKLMDINLVGTIQSTNIGIKHMSKETGGPGGVIINTSSQLGFDYAPYCPDYSASKFGVLGFSICVSMNEEILTKHGVRINVVCPSPAEAAPFEVVTACGRDLTTFTKISPEYVAESILLLIKDNSRNGVIMLPQNDHKFRLLKSCNAVEYTILPDEKEYE